MYPMNLLLIFSIMIYTNGTSETDVTELSIKSNYPIKISHYINKIALLSFKYKMLEASILNETRSISQVQENLHDFFKISQFNIILVEDYNTYSTQIQRIKKYYDELNFEVLKIVAEASKMVNDLRLKVSRILWRLEKIFFTDRPLEYSKADFDFLDSMVSMLPNEDNIMNNSLYKSLIKSLNLLKNKQLILLSTISNIFSVSENNILAALEDFNLNKKAECIKINKDDICKLISHFSIIFSSHDENYFSEKSKMPLLDVKEFEEKHDKVNSVTGSEYKVQNHVVVGEIADSSKDEKDQNSPERNNDVQSKLKCEIKAHSGIQSRMFNLNVDGIKYFVLRSSQETTEVDHDEDNKKETEKDKVGFASKIPRYIHKTPTRKISNDALLSPNNKKNIKLKGDFLKENKLIKIKPDDPVTLQNYLKKISSILSQKNNGINVTKTIKEEFETLYKSMLVYKTKSEYFQDVIKLLSDEIQEKESQIRRKPEEITPRLKLESQISKSVERKELDKNKLILEYQYLTNLFVKISSNYLNLFKIRQKLLKEEKNELKLRRSAILKNLGNEVSMNIFSDLVEGFERIWSINSKPFLNDVLLKIEEKVEEMIFSITEITTNYDIYAFFC